MIDELYLLLRISDVLVKNIIAAVVSLDARVTKDSTECRETSVLYQTVWHYISSKTIII